MRKSLFVALALALAAACGKAGQYVEDPAPAIECSLTMSAQSSDLEVQETIDAVLSNHLDPCDGRAGGAYTAEFARVEAEPDTDNIRLVFRVRPDAVLNPPQPK